MIQILMEILNFLSKIIYYTFKQLLKLQKKKWLCGAN